MEQKKKFVKIIRVPSIEHAAEAIGHKGEKINVLKHKTKALIISPIPGNDPVFIIKAQSAEALLYCEAAILDSCTNFDDVRLQKRNIIMPRQSVLSTFRLCNYQISIIIGKDGSVIKIIEQLFNVHIKSPDRSTENSPKEPIFVISGQQESVNNCITFIKLVLYKYHNYVEMTIEEYQSIDSLLKTYVNPIINLQSIKKTILLERLAIKPVRLTITINLIPKMNCLKYYCPLCFSYNAKKAKAFPCEHFVCCENCIVPLYRYPNSKCTTCLKKIDQFEIFNYWQ